MREWCAGRAPAFWPTIHDSWMVELWVHVPIDLGVSDQGGGVHLAAGWVWWRVRARGLERPSIFLLLLCALLTGTGLSAWSSAPFGAWGRVWVP